MTDISETKNKYLLPLDFDSTPLEFDSVESLENYIKEERDSWDWMDAASNSEENIIRNDIKNFRSLYFNELGKLVNFWNQNNIDGVQSHIEKLNGINSEWQFPSSRSPVGKYILMLSEGQKSVATYLWVLYSAPKATLPSNDPFLKAYNLIFNRSDARSLTAMRAAQPFIMIASSHLSRLALLIGESSGKSWLESLRELYDESINLRDDSTKVSTDLSNWSSSKRKEIDIEIDDARKDITEKFNAFRSSVLSKEKSRLIKAQELRDKSQKEVASAEETYRSQIALDASVSYWDTKKEEHSSSKFWLGWFLFSSVLLTGFVPFIMLFIQSYWISVGKVLKEELLLKAIDPSFAAVTLVLLSLGSYSIRFFSNQYQSQQHLYLEAEERKTMIMTYLALLSENKLDGHEDRKVALDTLFRPSQTGIVADQSAILPTEQIVKVIRTKATG